MNLSYIPGSKGQHFPCGPDPSFVEGNSWGCLARILREVRSLCLVKVFAHFLCVLVLFPLNPSLTCEAVLTLKSHFSSSGQRQASFTLVSSSNHSSQLFLYVPKTCLMPAKTKHPINPIEPAYTSRKTSFLILLYIVTNSSTAKR